MDIGLCTKNSSRLLKFNLLVLFPGSMQSMAKDVERVWRIYFPSAKYGNVALSSER